MLRAVARERGRLGRRLRQLRRSNKLTLEKAAERIGLHSKYLQRIELARENPALATLVAIALAYGVPVATLFDEED